MMFPPWVIDMMHEHNVREAKRSLEAYAQFLEETKMSETTPKPLPTEDEACPEKSPTKLDHQRGKMRVLADDISYLIMRIEHGSLASIAEHYGVQQEIHELQHILADWDSYIGMEITRKAAQLAIDGWISQVSMRVGRRQE